MISRYSSNYQRLVRKLESLVQKFLCSIFFPVIVLLLRVHLLVRYLQLRKLLLGTICYYVIIATIAQMLLRTPKLLKVILNHHQFKQMREWIESVRYAHQKQNSKQH